MRAMPKPARTRTPAERPSRRELPDPQDTPETATVEASERPETVKRATFPLTPTGKIDWDRIRPSNRAAIESILRTNQIADTVSHASKSDALAAMVWTLAGNLSARAALMRGFTAEESALLQYDNTDLKILIPMTQETLNDFPEVLSFMGRYTNLAMLAATAFAITSQKMQAMKALHDQRVTQPVSPTPNETASQPAVN